MTTENEEVLYCEWLFMGNPIERLTNLAHAKVLYEAKLKVLNDRKDSIGSQGSFIGIKKADGSNEWIIKNQ
jgi:hypothetical protein